MNTPELMVFLKQRYTGDEWAYFPQVRNGTGWGPVTRTADALAFNLWPSRGLTLIGFEVKADRNDWLRELKQPDKSAEIQKFCDHWFVVAAKGIVQPGELPPTWGLLLPRGNGLAVSVQAPTLKAEPLSREFIASLLRKAKGYVATPEETTAALKSAFAGGKADGKLECKWELDKYERMKERVSTFEEKSGLSIDAWDAGEIGEAVRALRRPCGVDEILKDREHAANELRVDLERTEKVIAELKALKERT